MIENIYKFVENSICWDDGFAEKVLFDKKSDDMKTLMELIEEEAFGKVEFTEQDDWEHILSAMSEFLYDYPAPCSYRQNIWQLLVRWLEDIAQFLKIKFDIDEVEEVMPKPVEKDMVIEMIKELHYNPKRGVSKDDLSAEFGVTDRTIKDIMNKLDSNNKNDNYRIAGHIVELDIKHNDIYDQFEQKRKRYFSSRNTVNPLFLQLNIAQVHSILNGLKNSYFEEERNMAISTAMEIWSQLSDYTKHRIITVYAKQDADLMEFIDIIENELGSTIALHVYKTEREQILEEDLSDAEMDELNMKLKYNDYF